MRIQFGIGAVVAAATCLSLGGAQAAGVPGQGTWGTKLQARDLDGDGAVDAVYQVGANITWLADANLAMTESFGVQGIKPNGPMSWGQAQDWIAAVNSHKYLGYADWRLPARSEDNSPPFQWSPGSIVYAEVFGLIPNEMSHLFFGELGGVLGNAIPSGPPGGTPLFRNTEPAYTYWLASEYQYNTSGAWAFAFGGTALSTKEQPFAVWAVRTGDVTAVPELGSMVLMLAGAGFLAFAVRRQKLRA